MVTYQLTVRGIKRPAEITFKIEGPEFPLVGDIVHLNEVDDFEKWMPMWVEIVSRAWHQDHETKSWIRWAIAKPGYGAPEWFEDIPIPEVS